MRETIINNLKSRFQAYAELLENVSEDALVTRIDAPKHKSLVEHLWCVVGARESYARALKTGQWDGFSCSLTAFSKADVQISLGESAKAVSIAIDSVTDWDPVRDELLATLAEHEVMHEGQIIRHVYGTEGTLPKSWKWA